RLAVLCGGIDDALPGRQPSTWIVGGKAGDGAIDQAWMALGHRLRSKAKPVHDAWTEVLNDHVGSGAQTLRCSAVAGTLQVERNTPFATVEESVGRRLPARPPRRVDVDDIGALVAQHHGGQRTPQ